MAAPRALLPQLGLFLCLALCFSPAFSASYQNPCMALDTVLTSDNLGISTKAGGSGGNRTYTVFVPVNSSVSAVILKAVNQNNNTVGSWTGPVQECNDTSVLYLMTSSNNSNFQATWIAPDSEDVTKINLQVSIVTANRTAMMSSVRLEQMTTPAPLTPTPETSGTSRTTTMTTGKSQTTTMTTAKSQTTTMTTGKSQTTTMTTGKSQTTTMTTGKSQTTTMTTAKSQTTTMTTGKSQTTTMTTAKSQTTTMTTGKSQTTTMTTAKTTARSPAVNALGSPLAVSLHILLVFVISRLLF
ncbi:placenta-expressed transcript 1 protein [Peromyscus californicus insignis]|uniref:placenta-expressed transcript 1 protein n=1 Tax=Peromyscus californicus insignis TaxID=564181 RepID=UPI0022A7C799|nr:placenta-expressed transcript 1 protein [Peromyscus californicus insignis]